MMPTMHVLKSKSLKAIPFIKNSSRVVAIILAFITSLSYANESKVLQAVKDSSIESDNAESYIVKSVEVRYGQKLDRSNQVRYANSFNEAQKQAAINLKEIETNDGVRKTRDEVIVMRNDPSLKVLSKESLNSKQSFTLQSYGYVEFDIYHATSSLLTDLDHDGFYQTFSVSFDADVYGSYAGQRAQVFADLYLSRNGGPWERFYTTDSFIIEDDSSDDEFEVLTTLGSGYATSHYDVLIDLYEVGYSGIVATISSDDVDGLYALPLESADRDEIVVQSYSSSVYVEAGSASLITILTLLTMVIYRDKSGLVK